MTPQQLLALDKYITAKMREVEELHYEKELQRVSLARMGVPDASNARERAFTDLREALEITNDQWWKVELADAKGDRGSD